MAKKTKNVKGKSSVLNLYVVKVTKPSAVPFYGPFLSIDDDMALTSFTKLAKSEPLLERSYLYRVGSFDQVSGVLKSCEKTLVVAKSPVCGVAKIVKVKKNEKVSDAV